MDGWHPDMSEKEPLEVTPHPSLPGVFRVEGWDFDYEQESDVEYIDRAIRALTAWKEFVSDQEDAPF